MKSLCLLLLVVCLVVQHSAGKKYCTKDDDCKELGALKCIKSQCELGVCGCPLGEAAVFLGHRYSCVPLKRIGERCSTDGASGLCGAPWSRCQEGRCNCTSDTVSRFGGVLCAPEGDRYPGETCRDGLCIDQTTCKSSGADSGADPYWYSAVNKDVPTCACGNNQKLVIRNGIDPALFLGSSVPACVNRKIGDSCRNNEECPGTDEGDDGIICDNKICACKNSTLKANYEGTKCNVPLSFGANCTTTIKGHCDGSRGLKCGDECTTHHKDYVAKCACGPQHTTSGSSCTPIKLGDKCFGDYNCKGFSPNGICVGGKCRNGGLRLESSSVGMLLVLLSAVFSIY